MRRSSEQGQEGSSLVLSVTGHSAQNKTEYLTFIMFFWSSMVENHHSTQFHERKRVRINQKGKERGKKVRTITVPNTTLAKKRVLLLLSRPTDLLKLRHRW